MVFIGSVIVLILVAFLIWLALSPIFSRVGSRFKNKLNKFTQEDMEE